jgi:sugar transferase (PEP-CTERM system associated)
MIKAFGHYIRGSYFFLGIIEFLILMGSLYLGVLVRFKGDMSQLEVSMLSLTLDGIIFSIIIILMMTSMGLYQSHLREGIRGIISRMLSAYILGAIVLAAVFYFLPDLYLGRGIMVISLISSFVLIFILRIMFRVNDTKIFKIRVLVLGTGNKANLILSRLRRKTDIDSLEIIGFVHLRNTRDVIDESNIVKLNMPIDDFVRQNNIELIVLANEERRNILPVHDLLSCKMHGVEIVDIETFFERQTGQLQINEITPSWFILNEGFKTSISQIATKRLFDILVSLILFVLAWPLMLLTVIIIKFEDGMQAPLLYKQIRIGENGKPFYVKKFRSMVTDAEKNGRPVWANKNDSRVTRVGRVIRATRIDELPQIFNVLNGEMSFVGPRPERPKFVNDLGEKIPYYNERHRFKPGITGWAQIRYPYGSTEKDALEKLQYDLYYIKNYSIFLDFLILIQTVEVVLFRKGSR